MKQSIEAVIHTHASSKEQEKEGYSIDAQVRLLCDYARKQGLMVLHEFVAVETAKKPRRKEFSSMLAFLKKKKTVRMVLVEKTDRPYRKSGNTLPTSTIHNQL